MALTSMLLTVGMKILRGAPKAFRHPKVILLMTLSPYADDTTLLEIVHDPAVSAGRLNVDLNKNAMWADKWSVAMNPV